MPVSLIGFVMATFGASDTLGTPEIPPTEKFTIIFLNFFSQFFKIFINYLLKYYIKKILINIKKNIKKS